jgi:hypothetical protein
MHTYTHIFLYVYVYTQEEVCAVDEDALKVVGRGVTDDDFSVRMQAATVLPMAIDK